MISRLSRDDSMVMRNSAEWLFDPFTAEQPSATHLRTCDYSVQPCSWRAAKDIVAEHHYSGSSSDITIYRHGLYRKTGQLVGAALWMPAPKPAALSVSDDWEHVLCLTRLVVTPNEPTNAASFLLGRSMRLIKQERRFHTLVTYADERLGHTGAIYRATNWDYLPPTQRQLVGDVAYFDTEGRLVSKRCKGGGSYTDQQMIDMGYQRGESSTKHKFVKRLFRVAT